MSSRMRKCVTARLPEALLKAARRKAAAEARTLTSRIEGGLCTILNDSAKLPKKKRILPRIRKAGGALMPGVDLADASTLQEADDLDYVRRMPHSE